jgi:hypothetical protein
MPRDVIPIRPDLAPSPPAAGPDVAFAALPLLRRLTDTLTHAARFRDACRRMQQKYDRRHGGVPRLFFFDEVRQEDWATGRDRPPTFPDPWAVPVARRRPRLAQAWCALPDQLDDALPLLAGSVAVRRVARAMPALTAALDSLAPDHAGVKSLARVLAVADDLIVTAVHPVARSGVRVRLTGIADVAQFHVLLADAVSPRLMPGVRPDPRAVDASRDTPVDPDAATVAATFQLYKPSALSADGALPPPFHGTSEWLWGHESPRDIPAVAGERLVLVGDPAYPRRWPAGRSVPLVAGEVRVEQVLSAAAVERWVGTMRGRQAA